MKSLYKITHLRLRALEFLLLCPQLCSQILNFLDKLELMEHELQHIIAWQPLEILILILFLPMKLEEVCLVSIAK